MGPFKDGWTKEQVVSVIEHDDPDEVLYVPIVVGMSAPECGAEWAQSVCLRLSQHESDQVRANALLGLGHIARTSQDLQQLTAAAAISRGLLDTSPLVQGYAQDAAADIRHFMGWPAFPA